MARKPGNYGDSNRDGIDDDIDHAPGNSSNSPEYAKRYDYGSSTEYTPYGVERADQIQSVFINKENQRLAEEARAAGLEAQSRVHYWPNVGKFIVPVENTWAAHAELVKDDKNALHFNPEKYLHFDKVIAEKAGIPALYDRSHPDYDRYEGLRTNLEVLRNDIIGIYVNDGSYDPGDEIFIPQIESIAESIAKSLANDSWYNRMLGRQSVNIDIANIEGVGAAAMYEQLLSMQQKPARMQALRDRLNEFFGLPADRIWDLPPMEETPYSPENLSAPPPKPKDCLTIEDIEQMRQQEQQQEIDDPKQEMSNLGDSVTTQSPRMSVEQMEEAAKLDSIEEARKILRNLRNMEFGDRDIEEWMDLGTPKAQMAKANAVNKLVQIHQLQMQLAQARNPDSVRDMFVEDGKFAADALRLATAEFVMRNLPKNHPQQAKLEQFVFSMPEHAHARQTQSLDRLLDNISTGLERATGKQVSERSPAERLISASNRIQKAARKMRSIETLDPPARQESLDLAHDILRRLKEMEMSRKPISEFIETARPEEKAAVAEKIDEVVDMYKNLVSEAATINPALMQDPRIQEGVDAVDEFAHTVKLMAAKEMPNSVASAQQIGADATQDPKEWDKLHDRTIERILTSMEGGLEEAVDTIDVQEQAEEQAEEEARDAAIDAAMHTHSMSSRKKRKRWTRSGAGGKRQDKISQDLRADDRSAGQGRFSPEGDSPQGNSVTANSAARGADKSGMNKQQKLNINLNADDRLQSEGRFREQEQTQTDQQQARRQNTSSASRNTRSGRSSARREMERQQASNQRDEARAARAASRDQERASRDEVRANRDQMRAARDAQRATSANSGGGSNSMGGAGNSQRSNPTNNPAPAAPAGVNVPKGLNPQALAALQQALKQEGNTLLNMNKDARNIPATPDNNQERDQQRQNNPRNPRGNERM